MPSQADINAGLYLIQCLEVIVDPTTEALPIDFGTNIPLVTDPSSNNNARGLGDRNPLYKGVRRQVRRGGSGVQPTRKQHAPLTARDNTNSAEVGGAVVSSDVLLNDTYTGEPTITIVAGPVLAGASARVTGGGNESLIEYTPPATGDGGQDRIRYRLRATGNRGSALATLRITVTATGPQTNTFGPYTAQTMGIVYASDGTLGFFSNNSIDTQIVFVPNDQAGPWGPYPGDPMIVACLPEDFDAIWSAFEAVGGSSYPAAFGPPGTVFTITTSPGTGPAGPTARDLDSWGVS